MTLTEFLLARIAEDEQAALDASEGGSQHWSNWVVRDGAVAVMASAGEVAPIVSKEDAGHIARHDPAYVLARCKADRRIVEDEHFDGRSGEHVAPFCSTCSDDEDLVYLPCPTLRLLALPYADHPDYREEWKP